MSSGKSYYYKVVAYKSSSSSAKSAAKKMIYLTAGNVSSLTNTVKGVKVQWSSVSGATGYYVYRKVSGGSFSKIATTDDTSYTDSSASVGTTYYYAVRPYKGSYTGAYTSSSITAQEILATPTLSTPSISSLTNSTCSTAVVKWGKTSSSVDGYQIQYSYSNSFTDPTTVTAKGASTVSTEITGLTRSKTVYVRVRSYQTISGTKYYSSWSSVQSVKITGSHNYETTVTTSGTTKTTTETCSICGDTYSTTEEIGGDDEDDSSSGGSATTGHWETVVVEEAWDETVNVYSDTSYYICTKCGAYYDSITDINAHILGDHDGASSYTVGKVVVDTYIVHHDAVTEQVWVED